MGKRLMTDKLEAFWRLVRQLSGDDSYERYLRHYASTHNDTADHQCDGPLSKAEFFKQWQEQKWNGIKRCC